jgi:hypothetical protein
MSDLFNIYIIIMLRFITKRTVPRRTAFCFCNKAFVDKIMHFRLADMRPEEILSEIDSFSSASSLVTAQSKLFIQLNSLLQGKELEQAKEVYLKRAIELFSHRGAFGQNGELLRQFIVKNQVSKLFSPELDRLFVEQTFLRLVKEGRDQELAAISLDAYINILESCVFNDLFDPEEIHHCTVYALQKVKFAERQVRPLGNLVVTHSLVLKKYKGRVPEATYSKLVESLLSVFNQTLHTLKNASFEESFDAILLATHINSCVEVFNGHSKQQVFEATWEIIELEFSQFIKKHSNKLINYIQEGEEGELLPLVEELNQAGSLYKNDTLKIHLLPAIENRLEVNYRKTSTSLVAQLINLAFKLESNFQVAPKYLSSLKVSKNDPVTSLQNASVTLDIFAKQQLGESLGPYMDQLQDFLIELLANPETKRSQLQVRLLLAVFKQLVQLGRGSIQLFKAYFEFFKQREVLEQVGLMSVLVQFLPALGLKTKKLAGAMTNTNDDQTSNVINVSQAINNQVRPSLTEVNHPHFSNGRLLMSLSQASFHRLN